VSVLPFDHPWLSGLLGDDEVAELFQPIAELRQMLAFERALAAAQAAEALIPGEAAEYIARRLEDFSPDDEALARGASRDGVVVPELIRQLRAFLGERGEFLHRGATSQDVIDTALVLRLRPAIGILSQRLASLHAALTRLSQAQGRRRLMGRTRMQDARPIAVADKLASWILPLERHKKRLHELRPRLLALQFGGAVGIRDGLAGKGDAIAQRMAETLDLELPSGSWHTQRDNLAEFAGWLALVSGSLGKIGADIGLMAQMGDIRLEGGGSSSAMPGKQNPVGAEVLVTLARFNATLVGGMHQAMVAEQERSGAAWSLEWLILPQILVATAGGLRRANLLAADIIEIGTDG
jgi:3-carboxy-cis,cis-muconate cycloisomerase